MMKIVRLLYEKFLLEFQDSCVMGADQKKLVVVGNGVYKIGTKIIFFYR